MVLLCWEVNKASKWNGIEGYILLFVFFLIKKSRNTKKSPHISQLSLFWVVVNPNIILFWLIVEWHLNFCEMLKDFIVTIKEHFFFCLVKKEKRHFNYLSTRFLDSVRCPIWLESLIWIENLNFHFTILNFLLFKNKHLEQFMDLTSHNAFLFHWTSCDFVWFVIKKPQKQFNTWIRQKHFIVLYYMVSICLSGWTSIQLTQSLGPCRELKKLNN